MAARLPWPRACVFSTRPARIPPASRRVISNARAGRIDRAALGEAGPGTGCASALPRSKPILRAVHMLAFMSPWSTVAQADVIRELGGFLDRRALFVCRGRLSLAQAIAAPSVAFQMSPPLVRYHTEASNLARNLAAPGPSSRFCSFPRRSTRSVPCRCVHCSRDILAIRALKTACMLGYWGQWRPARALRTRFGRPACGGCRTICRRSVCSTPLGGMLRGDLAGAGYEN